MHRIASFHKILTLREVSTIISHTARVQPTQDMNLVCAPPGSRVFDHYPDCPANSWVQSSTQVPYGGELGLDTAFFYPSG